MNLRLTFCIAMGVFVAHLGAFMIWTHLHPAPLPPKPVENFRVRSKAVVDRETGEKLVYREITVSTRLASPAPLPQARPEIDPQLAP